MEPIQINVEDSRQHKKMPSMPMTTQNLKGHSRLSSSLEGITNASSLFTDRYNEEAEKLDWAVPHLTTQHKDLYTACNKYT